MLVLAIETSLEIASCAIWNSEKNFLLAELKAHAYQTLTQRLPELVQASLDAARVKLGDIGLIAVSLGPGSFTSVRVSLAFAKGLSMALDKPILGVKTLEALALAASVGENSLVVALYPSRPSKPTEVYAAFFQLRNGLLERDGNEQAIEFHRLVSTLKTRRESWVTFVGVLPPGAKNLLTDLQREKQIALPLIPCFPSASLIAQRAWQQWQRNPHPDDPIALTPNYVLPSSAESRLGITVSVKGTS